MKRLAAGLMTLAVIFITSPALASDGSKGETHVGTGGGPDGISTVIDSHVDRGRPDSDSGARGPDDPNALPALPCFGADPNGLGPACPATPGAPATPTLSDALLRDLVPWPTATIVFTPGDLRGLVGLKMGMYATGALTVGVGVIDPTTGTSVSGTGRAVAWEWHPADETQPSLAIRTSSPGTAQDPAAFHAWPTRGIKAVTVIAFWEADLLVTYPDGTTEARHVGPVPITSTRPFHFFEVQALITDAE